MGVPAFYSWLVGKYPKIVTNAVEKSTEEPNDDGGSPPANPNGIEFDNLYLDMNGIIHPCFHPEYDDVLLHHENTPATFEEVFKNIFEYIDRIINIVKPRKLLYMAIDGVAPRAKMNQQRTRRFKTAKEQDALRKEEDRLRIQFEIEGKELLPNEESEVSDSNVVTPGTEFMYELSKQLQIYIRLRIANHHAWKHLKVILSDASSPGEGEHKIMSFIRLQRTCKGYNPNTSHVLYGLDADLIMLALATHEVHFSILRENVSVKNTYQTNNSSMTVISEANAVKCRGWFENVTEQISNLEISTSKQKSIVKKPYQFLHVWILREYLKLDLKLSNMPERFEPDFERLIDDFIFICFFAGNDFLPHMPTLDIHEGAMDLLIHVYKEEFKNLGGYLLDAERVNDKKGGYIKLKRVEKFILSVGAYEDKIFKKRSGICESRLRRFLSNVQKEGNEEENLFPVASTYSQESTRSNVNSPCSSRSPDHNNMQIVENTKLLKEKLKSYTYEESDFWKNGSVTDMVKFGSPGWKNRYYKCKFSAETDDDIEKVRKRLVEKYTEGLCWVLLYYFSGVPSWTWFFPYHYGPFASDLKGMASTKVIFQKGLPFKPFDQLMAVLPPRSAHSLPLSYQQLMTDEGSSILDFYPSHFDTDTDGKRFQWQAICKLPFIDEERLLAATKKIEKELGEEEAKRNTENADRLFVHSSENFALQTMSTFYNAGSIENNSSIKIDTGLSGDINGFVRPVPEAKKDDTSSRLDVLCVYYDLPCFSVHISRVLEGTTFPETVVCDSDIEERQLWHNIQGNNRTEVSNRNPNIGFRNSSPDVVIKGAGSGWCARGRGRPPQSSLGFDRFSCHETARNPPEQTRGQSWSEAYSRGRGAQGNRNGYYRSTNYPARGAQGNRNGYYRSTNYPARTYGTNSQYLSAWNDPGNDQESRRWGNTQSANAPGDGNYGRSRRWGNAQSANAPGDGNYGRW